MPKPRELPPLSLGKKPANTNQGSHSKAPGVPLALAQQVAKMARHAVDAPGRGRGQGAQLTVLAPDATVRALRIAAAERGTTTRALVLEALAKAGWPVPKDELRDRRR